MNLVEDDMTDIGLKGIKVGIKEIKNDANNFTNGIDNIADGLREIKNIADGLREIKNTTNNITDGMNCITSNIAVAARDMRLIRDHLLSNDEVNDNE